jgi:hypothetical protein
MDARHNYLFALLITVTVLSFLMAYFVKPHPFQADIVLPENSVAKPSAPGTHSLADRVAKSCNLALVLVRSEYSETNANALESLRNWASKNFQRDPNFLHPPSLETQGELNQSIIDSFSYSMLASLHSLFEGQIAGFLRARIDDFHHSEPYATFSNDYNQLFGKDADSATLLARYQSGRARQAIDPLLGAMFWVVMLCVSAVIFFRGKFDSRAGKGQSILAYTWIALALFYIVSGWIQNQVPILISAIICGGIGLYVWRPIKISYGENRGLSFELLRIPRRTLVLLYWITVSMLLIRIVSWIKTGTLLAPDPITLIISALTGDFLHDPADIKRNIDRFIGAVWTLFSLWTILQLAEEPEEEFDQEEDLAPIQRAFFSVDP